MKKALMTVITGQHGACLVKLWLSKGYEGYDINTRSSLINTHRIDCLYKELHQKYG